MKKIILYIVSEDWYFLSHRLPLALKAKKEGYEVHVLCKDTGVMNNIKNRSFPLLAGCVFIPLLQRTPRPFSSTSHALIGAAPETFEGA